MISKRSQEREERRARFEAILEQRIKDSLNADQKRAEYIERLRVQEVGHDADRTEAMIEAHTYIRRLRYRHKMSYANIAQRVSDRFPQLGQMTWYKIKDALEKANGEWRPR